MIKENDRINLIQAIFNFIQKFKPYLTEAEFLHENRNKEEIELLNENFNLIEDEDIEPTQCCWLFSIPSLNLKTKIGNVLVSEEKYTFEESLLLFEKINPEEFIKHTEEELTNFYKAYSISQGEFDLAHTKETFINYGGGNIDCMKDYKNNLFKYMKEQVLNLCKGDFNNFIKTIISIEMQESNQEVLDLALNNYLKNDCSLINPKLFEGANNL